MYLLYLDESGSARNPSDAHFILSGVGLHESQAFWLGKALDELAAKIDPSLPETLEFHGSHMFARKGRWRQFTASESRNFIRQALALKSAIRDNWALFGSVVEKAALPGDPISYAFEQVSSRFDRYLTYIRGKGKGPHRGLILLDKSSQEIPLQSLATTIKLTGDQWGTTPRWYADVPYFADSRVSRMIQYADLVSYALWRNFEKNDPSFFDVIRDDFHANARGIVRGLTHHKKGARVCDCPACQSRATQIDES